jgi:hypothetical protein
MINRVLMTFHSLQIIGGRNGHTLFGATHGQRWWMDAEAPVVHDYLLIIYSTLADPCMDLCSLSLLDQRRAPAPTPLSLLGGRHGGGCFKAIPRENVITTCLQPFVWVIAYRQYRTPKDAAARSTSTVSLLLWRARCVLYRPLFTCLLIFELPIHFQGTSAFLVPRASCD